MAFRCLWGNVYTMLLYFVIANFASTITSNPVDLFSDVDTNKITGPLEEMRKAGYQEEMVEKNTADEKIEGRFERINVKFNEVVSQLDEDQKEAAVGAISSVVSGSGTLVQGIRNDDVMSAISGGLEIAAAVVSLAGPVGSIVGTVLTLVSTIFSFFGGSTAPVQKKEEPNFKKIVEDAIEEANLSELKIQIAGVKALYKIVSASVAEFSKEIEKGEALTTGEGLELYDHAFKELVAYGILREVIDKYCDDAAERKDKETYAKRCGTFIRLYCNLAIQRKLLLLDIASVLSNNTDLNGVTKNTLFVLKKQLKDDHEFFRFLFDPINFPKRRYGVHKLFEKPQDNQIVIIYLKLLRKTFPHFPGFYKPPVIGCSGRQLQKTCVALFDGTPAHFNNNHGSVFVPLGVKVTQQVVLNNQNQITESVEETKTDVLLGAATHILSNNLYQNLLKLTYEETDTDASEHVVICGQKGDITDLCKVFERPADGEVEYAFKNLFTEVTSVLLPDRYDLILVKADNSEIRKFHGPDYMQDVCVQSEWNETEKIKIKKGESIKKVKLCSEADLAGRCQNIVVPKHVQIDPVYDITTGRDGACAISAIKSMKIPEGVEISIHERKDWVPNENSKGPFTGPVTINLQEHTDWKIVKVYDLTLSPVCFCNSVGLKGVCYQRSDGYGGDRSRIQGPFNSMRVPSDMKVTLYTEQLYEGTGTNVTGPKRLINSRFMSYQVRRT